MSFAKILCALALAMTPGAPAVAQAQNSPRSNDSMAHSRTKSYSASYSGSILEMSIPAAGSTVQGPVDELILHFNPPARLDEVTVTGPEGAMPMMVTSVGEVQDYSLPLPALGAGAYSVAWRATAQGHAYQGSFAFTVR